MFQRLVKALGGGGRRRKVDESKFDRLQIAAAALLVQNSSVDAVFDADERRAIEGILARRFTLSPEDAEDLVIVGEEKIDEVYSDDAFTRAVRAGYGERERRELVRMLWEVAAADGDLHKFEEAQIGRVGKELGLSPEAVEAARAEAKAASEAAHTAGD